MDRYELETKLGEGGMGAVYRARDKELGRVVAIKVISMTMDSDSIRRFQREMKLLSRLSHPNIIRVFDSGQAPDGRAYFAMELIEGQDLERIRKSAGKVPFDRAVTMLTQAADGLASVHAAGLLHRDIKPANIMIETSGRLVIMDFGLVKDPNATMLTQEGSAVGTPRYMPPEVFAMREPTGAVDVWALALTAHEMLTGGQVFPGLSMTQIIESIVRDPPPDLATGAPGTPRWFVDLHVRALSKDPAARPTAAEYRDALKRRGMRVTGRVKAPEGATEDHAASLAMARTPSGGMRLLATPATAPSFADGVAQRAVRIAVAAVAIGALAFALRVLVFRRAPSPELPAPAAAEPVRARFEPPRRMVVALDATLAPGARVACDLGVRAIPGGALEVAFDDVPPGAALQLRVLGPDGADRVPPRTVRTPAPVRTGNLACHPTEEGVLVDFDLAVPRPVTVSIHRPGLAAPVAEVTRDAGPRWFHHLFPGLTAHTGYFVRAVDPSGWCVLTDYPFETKGTDYRHGLESLLQGLEKNFASSIYDLDLLRGAPDDRAIPFFAHLLGKLSATEVFDARKMMWAIEEVRSEQLSAQLFEIYQKHMVSFDQHELFRGAVSGRAPALLAASADLLDHRITESEGRYIATAVGDAGGAERCDRLAAYLDKMPASVDDRMAYHLVRCDPEAARVHLERWARRPVIDPSLRRLAMDGLWMLGDERAVQALADVAAHAAPDTAAMAARRLALTPLPAARAELAAALRERPDAPGLTWAAALGGADVADALALRLAPAQPEVVREDAALALGTLESSAPPALAALRAALAGPAPRVADAAAWALGQCGDASAAAELEAMAASDRDAQGAAALALARLKQRAAAPRLASRLAELAAGSAARPPRTLGWLRMGALASALAELGDPASAPALRALVEAAGVPRPVRDFAQGCERRLAHAEAEAPGEARTLVVAGVMGVRGGAPVYPGESVEVSGFGLLALVDQESPMPADLTQLGPELMKFGITAVVGTNEVRVGRSRNRVLAEQPAVVLVSAYDKLRDGAPAPPREAVAGFAWFSVRR